MTRPGTQLGTIRSRELMLDADKKRQKKKLPSDLIKIAHHGSINASPPGSFKAVMPSKRAANAAFLSTDPSRFTGPNEVPKDTVIADWKARLKSKSRFKRTHKVARGESVALTFKT